MRCAGLLERPWGLKHEEIVQAMLLTERPNVFNGTIRNRPQQWTPELWRGVYNFLKGRAGLANRMDSYIDNKFTHRIDPKDGYPIRDCRNARQHRLF